MGGMSLRSAVIPAAGLGTRFLPATKVQPKEMLAIVDRPLIQYAAEEASAAGVSKVVLVSAPGKHSLEQHFRPRVDLEAALQRAQKPTLLEMVREVELLASFTTVLQQEPRGVGDAILTAAAAVDEGPFAVMFPDDLVVSAVPVLEQLRQVHSQTGGNVLAVRRVPATEVSRYGVICGEPVGKALYEVRDLVEKPSPSEAPSDLAIIGRYILMPEIFSILERTAPGVGGEIQLTDAIRDALSTHPCHALVFEGDHFDCGSVLGFLKATVVLGRRHPRAGAEFRRFLERFGR